MSSLYVRKLGVLRYVYSVMCSVFGVVKLSRLAWFCVRWFLVAFVFFLDAVLLSLDKLIISKVG